MTDNELHDLEPGEALQMYLTDRQETDGIARSTVKSKRSRVGMFVDWCRENDVEYLSRLDGMDLHRWRLETADGIAKRTLMGRLSEVRVFLRWARDADAAPHDLPEKIDVPDFEKARTRMIEADRMGVVLDYLRKYEYASRDHVILLLFWRTAVRLGALRTVDVDDYHPDGECLELVHRPETGTPLKNGEYGERHVALSDSTCTVIDDYIDRNRQPQTDDNGREPLLTTVHGRVAIVSVRRTVYRYTRPCVYAGECPEGKDPDDCDAAQNYDQASQCPKMVSPHDIRRGAITHMLKSKVPKQVVSDRADVSPDVLDKHYNQMTEREKMEQRRDYLEGL